MAVAKEWWVGGAFISHPGHVESECGDGVEREYKIECVLSIDSEG